MHADVIVVGLGTMGGAAAYHLARRGLRVVALDRFSPPHQRGAHAGGSRIIRMAYMEGEQYVPLVRRSYQLWRELESASGRPLLTVTGGLMLGQPDSVVVAGALAAARAHNLTYEVLDADEIRYRFRAFTPADDEVGVFEDVAGFVRPEQAVVAHLRLARAAGAELHQGVAVDGWRASPSGVTVTTAEQQWHAGWLVLAPGAWATRLIPLDGAPHGATGANGSAPNESASAEQTSPSVPLRVQRRVQHYWLPVDEEPYGVGRFPVWIWDYGPQAMAYGLPLVDGRVKAAFHYANEPVDPDLGAAPARLEEVESVRAWLASRLPGLATGRYLSSKPCLYTLTPDEHFVLGRHPQHDNVALACGFSGHGFKFAPVVGEILADLVTTGATAHQISQFAPARLPVRA